MARQTPVSTHGAFTRVGSSLWDWLPFVNLDNPWSRIVWLGLYTSSYAKRLPPGLWHGGPALVAEAAKAPPMEAYESLKDLATRRMIEIDPKLWVIRLIQLPDKGERPTQGNAIRSWWTRFQTVPRCQVRDEWVTLLRWLSEPFTPHHDEAWNETFLAVEKSVDKSRRGIPSGMVSGMVSPMVSQQQLDLSVSGHMEIPSPMVYGEGDGSDLGSDLRGESAERGDAAAILADDPGVTRPRLHLVSSPSDPSPPPRVWKTKPRVL